MLRKYQFKIMFSLNTYLCPFVFTFAECSPSGIEHDERCGGAVETTAIQYSSETNIVPKCVEPCSRLQTRLNWLYHFQINRRLPPLKSQLSLTWFCQKSFSFSSANDLSIWFEWQASSFLDTSTASANKHAGSRLVKSLLSHS